MICLPACAAARPATLRAGAARPALSSLATSRLAAPCRRAALQRRQASAGILLPAPLLLPPPPCSVPPGVPCTSRRRCVSHGQIELALKSNHAGAATSGAARCSGRCASGGGSSQQPRQRAPRLPARLLHVHPVRGAAAGGRAGGQAVWLGPACCRHGSHWRAAGAAGGESLLEGLGGVGVLHWGMWTRGVLGRGCS